MLAIRSTATLPHQLQQHPWETSSAACLVSHAQIEPFHDNIFASTGEILPSGQQNNNYLQMLFLFVFLSPSCFAHSSFLLGSLMKILTGSRPRNLRVIKSRGLPEEFSLSLRRYIFCLLFSFWGIILASLSLELSLAGYCHCRAPICPARTCLAYITPLLWDQKIIFSLGAAIKQQPAGHTSQTANIILHMSRL